MFLNWTVLTFHSGVYIFSSDAILNMVNNIAVNVLGGGPEMQGMTGAITSFASQCLFFEGDLQFKICC